MAILKRTRKSDGVIVYQIDYRTSDGSRVREKAGYSREAAKRLLQKRLGDDSAGAVNSNRKARTPFREFVKLYLERHAATRKRPEWYDWLTGCMLAEFGDTPLRNVTAFRVQGYINHLAKRDEASNITNGTTLGHHRRAVYNVFARAVEWGYLSANPVSAVKTPRPREARERFLTREEADKLIEKCRGDVKHIVRLMLNTALRSGEALSLKWSDVREDHLLVRTSKTGRARWVPLNDQARAALDARRENRKDSDEWVFPGRAKDGRRHGFKREFEAACKLAGIRHGIAESDGVVPHTLRHTAISWMLQAGAPLYAVGKVSGHSAASMTERYGHLEGCQLADAVRLLDRPVVSPVDTRRDRVAVSGRDERI